MQHVYKFNLENPRLESLGYVIAVANLDDKHDRSAPSDYHWKILKCRMIIFSSKSILACPEKKDSKQVHVVFNKLGDDYDKLNSLFTKFSLTQNGPIQATTPDVYRTCFEYTMTAKIAPIWNTVGLCYLINNRDFLTTKGPQDGVSYHLITNENETILEIKPVKIHFLGMDEDYNPGEWIRVLPSLNKAIVEEYSEKIPLENFKSYKDLRRHWKNIHGYRLPEDEPPYYSIRFWREAPLTYPKLCVTRSFPIITPVPKAAGKHVVEKFLSCLKTKMSNVTGRPLVIKGVSEITTNLGKAIEKKPPLITDASVLKTTPPSLCYTHTHKPWKYELFKFFHRTKIYFGIFLCIFYVTVK